MAEQTVVVEGTVSIRERIAVPPGAVVTVKLIDASGEVVAAAARVSDVVPAPFSLAYDPALVPDASRLFVWAALRTEVGVWGTPELSPVAEEPDHVLTRIPD
ncbi:MAG: YbaY family lipoprotein [Aeromicrobium sp.]